MKTFTVQVYNNTKADLSQYLTAMFQYYLRHGVTLNYDITATSVTGYQSTLVSVLLVGNVYVLTGVEKLVPATGHDMVMFVYDYSDWKAPWYWPWPLWGNVPRDDTYMANGKPFMNIGYWPTDTTVGQRFIHEPMHALTRLANAAGDATVDQMDTYVNDSNPDAPAGNFATQWTSLQPFLNPMTNTTVTIKRHSDNGTETLGTLACGSFACSTLERPWLDNQHNVSCIPTGTYQAILSPLGTFNNQPFYELQNVPNRTGIFIHPANYVSQLEGCIALGINPSDINHDGQIDVTSSVDTVAAFMKATGGKPITVVIS